MTITSEPPTRIVPALELVEQVAAEVAAYAEQRPDPWTGVDALRSLRDSAARCAARALAEGDPGGIAARHVAYFRAAEVVINAGRSGYFGPAVSS